LEELLENKKKVLVFSFFSSMLDLVEIKMQERNIRTVKITGETKDRKSKVDAFQTDDDIQVFLISLKAGGTGLNLTAAEYVFLLDPWWNPAVEQQAIDRTHRIGQDKHVFAYKMICKNTIEEKILLLQQKKKSIANELINIESGVLKKLTKDDVMDLLG
jgi:SNF2 family DNA or RNA helicase